MTEETVQDTSVQSDIPADVSEETTTDGFLAEFDDDVEENTHSDETGLTEAETDDVSYDDDDMEKFTVTVNGEEKRLSRDEMVTAAQKGMDYDRIKEDKARLTDEVNSLRFQVGSVIEAAEQMGMSVDDFVKSALEGLKTAKADELKQGYIDQGIDEDIAEMLAEKDMALQNIQQSQSENETPEQQNGIPEEDIRKFTEAFPDVIPEEIPDSVWEQVRQGSTLYESYLKHEYDRQHDALRASQKNEENRQRASGSARTSKAQQHDAFILEFEKD